MYCFIDFRIRSVSVHFVDAIAPNSKLTAAVYKKNKRARNGHSGGRRNTHRSERECALRTVLHLAIMPTFSLIPMLN